ncbi:hypothetical protein V3C99_009156 [Haemonchus contortus]|nr:Hypothetical protein CBG05431 [Haemonchus contortus]
MRFLSIALIHTLGVSTLARGISKQKPIYEWRAFDSPTTGIPCRSLNVNGRRHWNDRDDCLMQIRASKDIMLQMTPPKRIIIDKRSKVCKPPEVIYTLPDRLRKKILDIWEERDPNGDCYQQQRRTRLILLNLPPTLWKSLRPKALQCSLPHFIDRLEWDLQVKLRKLWAGYKKGEPCSMLVAKQLRLLQQHDISVKSFDMPPPTVFRRYQLFQKVNRTTVV